MMSFLHLACVTFGVGLTFRRIVVRCLYLFSSLIRGVVSFWAFFGLGVLSVCCVLGVVEVRLIC